MGWTVIKDTTRDELIGMLTMPNPGFDETLKYHLANWADAYDVLYTVKKTVKGRVYVCVYLLDEDPEFGWGYKDMPESMHPFYYACPLEFLDLLSEPVSEDSAAWRRKVREYWV